MHRSVSSVNFNFTSFSLPLSCNVLWLNQLSSYLMEEVDNVNIGRMVPKVLPENAVNRPFNEERVVDGNETHTILGWTKNHGKWVTKIHVQIDPYASAGVVITNFSWGVEKVQEFLLTLVMTYLIQRSTIFNETNTRQLQWRKIYDEVQSLVRRISWLACWPDHWLNDLMIGLTNLSSL